MNIQISNFLCSGHAIVRLQSWYIGPCTGSIKMLAFCAKTVVTDSHNFEQACLKKEEEEQNRLWLLWQFSGSIFYDALLCHWSLAGHENTSKWIVCCYKGLQLYHFETLKILWTIIYCVSTLSFNVRVYWLHEKAIHISNSDHITAAKIVVCTAS